MLYFVAEKFDIVGEAVCRECGEPAVVRVGNYMGWSDLLCRAHAREALDTLASILGVWIRED